MTIYPNIREENDHRMTRSATQVAPVTESTSKYMLSAFQLQCLADKKL